MGFLAKGNNIILAPEGGERSISYLYKYRNEPGEEPTYEDALWGDTIEDLYQPVVYSTWSNVDDDGEEEGSYKYCNLGSIDKSFEGLDGKALDRIFNRNNRIDSVLKTSITTSADISTLKIISVLVKVGSDSLESAVKQAAHEYLAGEYNNVIAVSEMHFSYEDDRNVAVDYTDRKEYKSSMLLVKDYTVQENDNLALAHIAILPNAVFSGSPTITFNVYKQYFIEFLGNNTVSPGSIGNNEINPNYKAVNAINNYVMEFDDDNIITVDGNNVLVIPEAYVTELKQPSIYFGLFNNLTESFSKVSLGYYDMTTEGTGEEVPEPNASEQEQEGQGDTPTQSGEGSPDQGTFVSVGTIYNATVSGTINNKICCMSFVNNAFTIKSIM